MNRAGFGRVGVLAGGPSNERDISLRSGRAVYNALLQEGIDALFIDVRDNIYDIIRSGKIDVAFIALHGRFGEDGTVQKILDSAGIRYTGSGERSSRLAIDKIASKEVFFSKGIPTPAYIVIEKEEYRHCDNPITRLLRRNTVLRHPPRNDGTRLKFPVVVKPQFEGSSIGLSVVKHPEDMRGAVEAAFLYGDKILAEEYISGRELTVGILNEKPLPVVEIVTKDHIYDYKAKYSDPDTKYLVPAPIMEDAASKARSLAVEAHKALGCKSFSRVDMMMDGHGNIFVLEVNTIPGMTERSLLPKAAGAAGINFNQLCVKLIEDAL